MTTDSTTPNVPRDLGAPAQQLHDANLCTHWFFSQSPSSIVRSTQLRETPSIGHSRPTKVRVFLQCIADVNAKPSLDLDLTNVEFSSLPSGLHLVEEDVVCVLSSVLKLPLFSTPRSRYFTKGDNQGVSVFRRRETSEQGHRGFRLSSIGVLLAKSSRPRPWRHVPSLKTLIRSMYSHFKEEGIYDPGQFDWSPAEIFFKQREVSRADSFDSGHWSGWSDELDSVSAGVIFFLSPDTLYFAVLTFWTSLIRIFTTPLSTCLTFFAFSDYPPSRCTNTSSVASES
jgi:hypothetical protein